MNLLQGKIALITGGSRGIGESLVRKFVEQGASGRVYLRFGFFSKPARRNWPS
jgi:NAD(P)-dependent dehydrogenase (short-subunit alcohol dehydrogenase family)